MNRPMAKPTPELLRNVSLFSDLDEKDLRSLADEFSERRFSAGDTVSLGGDGRGARPGGRQAGPRLLVRRDRADRPSPADGHGDGHNRAAHLWASGLRVPAVRRGPPGRRVETARGDGGPPRDRRVPVAEPQVSTRARPRATRSS